PPPPPTRHQPPHPTTRGQPMHPTTRHQPMPEVLTQRRTTRSTRPIHRQPRHGARDCPMTGPRHHPRPPNRYRSTQDHPARNQLPQTPSPHRQPAHRIHEPPTPPPTPPPPMTAQPAPGTRLRTPPHTPTRDPAPPTRSPSTTPNSPRHQPSQPPPTPEPPTRTPRPDTPIRDARATRNTAAPADPPRACRRTPLRSSGPSRSRFPLLNRALRADYPCAPQPPGVVARG
ncbi:hypothetical protein APR09_002028, partial [Nocardia amikacinitolerans]|nr:hypothetical protein [Nocardia amikacinitolerans]